MTREFIDLAEKHGFHPGEVLIRVAKGDKLLSLAYIDKETGEAVEKAIAPTLDQMLMADKELAQYIYPKRKAVEHSGSIGTHEATLDDLA